MPGQRLQVCYPNRRALLSSARTERSLLTLFLPGAGQVAAGTDLLLELSVEHTTLRLELEARVRQQVLESDARGGGLSVAVQGEHRKAASQLLATCAATAEDGSAHAARHALEVRCLIDLHGQKLRGVLEDVSLTGAFVRAPRVPGLRSAVELTLQVEPLLGRWGGQVLKARVIWVGEKRGVHGFGARFLEGGAVVQERLKKHLPLVP